jgi:hypothetical protein
MEAPSDWHVPMCSIQKILDGCYDTGMSLPFDSKRFLAYEIEFGAGGQRLGCKFLLDDGSLLYVVESDITPEFEQLIASLGSPTEWLGHRPGNLHVER